VFETAELGRSVGKEESEAEVPKLRKAGVPVIVLLAGADGVGKGETVKRVLEWLDARGLDTHAFGPPTDEERESCPSRASSTISASVRRRSKSYRRPTSGSRCRSTTRGARSWQRD